MKRMTMNNNVDSPTDFSVSPTKSFSVNTYDFFFVVADANLLAKKHAGESSVERVKSAERMASPS